MKTINFLEKEDVREQMGKINVDKLTNKIYEAVDALEDFARGSIYNDISEGYGYEDNITFFETQKDDLLRTLKLLRTEIDGYIEELEKMEPCL